MSNVNIRQLKDPASNEVFYPQTDVMGLVHDGEYGVEAVPTAGSVLPVQSGGVLDSIIKDGSAFDLSAYTGDSYASLSAALTAMNALSAAYKKGGMSIKFVLTSDKKYVQYRLTSNSFSTEPVNWQEVSYELTKNDPNCDFSISDKSSNKIVIFKDGEIETKNFNSRTLKVFDTNADFEISDTNNFSILLCKDGHIKTKYFDSKDFCGSPLAGKTVVCIGDSITYGQGLTDRETEVYHAQLAQKTGCNNNGQGVSGTGLCTNMTNGLSSSRFITRATSETLNNADIIVVFGGTNDFTYDSKTIGAYYNEQTITPSGRIGNKEKVAPTDTDTFSGALHELITHIRGISDAPIIFITPLHRANYAVDRPNSWQANINGDYLSDYIDAIKSICADYSVPVLDLYSCYNLDFNDASMRDAFSVDGIHPNKAGHTIICNLLYKFIINNINI